MNEFVDFQDEQNTFPFAGCFINLGFDQIYGLIQLFILNADKQRRVAFAQKTAGGSDLCHTIFLFRKSQ